MKRKREQYYAVNSPREIIFAFPPSLTYEGTLFFYTQYFPMKIQLFNVVADGSTNPKNPIIYITETIGIALRSTYSN